MRKVVVTEFLTLDGVMEDPGGAENFKYGGWTRAYNTERFKYDELFASDAQLLGRVTYEEFAAAWPTVQGTGDFGERMNSMTKYVVSTTLKKADWNNSHIINGNVAEEVTKLKQQPGQDILVAGSATLIQTLIQHNLVDEYRLLVYPVVLGSGKRLFKDGSNTTLNLVETIPFKSGVVAMIYQPAQRK